MFPLGMIGKERVWKGNIHGLLDCQEEHDSPTRDLLSEPLSPFLKSNPSPEVYWTQEEWDVGLWMGSISRGSDIRLRSAASTLEGRYCVSSGLCYRWTSLMDKWKQRRLTISNEQIFQWAFTHACNLSFLSSLPPPHFSHMSKSCFSLKVNPQIQSPLKNLPWAQETNRSLLGAFTSPRLFFVSHPLWCWHGLPSTLAIGIDVGLWYRESSLRAGTNLILLSLDYHSNPCPNERSVSTCLWGGREVVPLCDMSLHSEDCEKAGRGVVWE